MVAAATVKEYFGAFLRGEPDEVTTICKAKLDLPVGSRLYQRASNYRQWTFNQSPSYTMYLVIEINEFVANPDDNTLRLYMQGGWRSVTPELEGIINGVKIKLADYRTSKEALEALLDKFVELYRKPESRGSVKVHYDESQYIWSWKRPSSDVIVYDPTNTVAYNRETCLTVVHIMGEGIVPDEYRYLGSTERSTISNNRHDDIALVGSLFYFKVALTPVYRNQVPFTDVYAHIPTSQVSLWEYVMVNDERRYINLKKTENSLLATPIHGYSTRIESLVPASRLFLRGKTDLYAKRDQEEVPFLGWELEACSNESSVGTQVTAKEFKEHMPWLIMCKNDGSISPEGFETVSVPATLDFWQESCLSSTLDSMRAKPHNMRSYQHVKCGFHVHVSRSALTVLDLQKLERFIHNPANNEFVVKIAGRDGGQYQQYMPDLFSNRKKWAKTHKTVMAAPRRFTDEDVMYFVPSWEKVHEYAENQMGMLEEGTPIRRRLINFGGYLSDFVSYDHLDNILRMSPLLHDLYPEMEENYSIGDIYPDLQRSDPVYLNDMTGSSLTVDHEAIYKNLFEKILCVGRPKMGAWVKKFFPEWDVEFEEFVVAPPPEENTSWKAGRRKSEAPYKRSSSRSASQIIKGPVGKGVMSRYDCLNTTNANTVEFRMFKGTMNGTTIMRYLEFVDAMVRFVANTSATDQGLHYSAFVRWLRSDAFNITRYEHLVSFITENGFIERKDIKRKVLPTVVSEDKDVEGLVIKSPEGFKELTDNKPIGSFTFTPDAVEPPAMSEDDADEQYDVFNGEDLIDMVDEDEEDDYIASCDCEDCQRQRGEID